MNETIFSWLVTYLLHSTVLLGGAWLASRRLPRESLAAKETLWRAAVVGGLLTACLQIGLGVEPRFGALRLTEITAPAGLPVASTTSTDFLVKEQKVGSRVPPKSGSPVSATLSAAVSTFADPTLPTATLSNRGAPAVETARKLASTTGVLILWMLGALALVGWLAASALVLARRLADRRALAEGPLAELLTRLMTAVRAPDVRLSASRRLASPIAFGWRRREICLPERLAHEMPAERQELVLAHELAHHVRRDPLWLVAARLIESVFFFQPLNHLARRRLQEISEYRCDDWAVEHTGRPVGLARCLAEVAEWTIQREAALPVPGLAAGRRRLSRRVDRLLTRTEAVAPAPRPRWLAAGIVATLALVVALVPGVSNGHPPPPPEPEAAPTALAADEAEAAATPSAPVSPVSAPSPAPAVDPSPVVAPAPPAKSGRAPQPPAGPVPGPIPFPAAEAVPGAAPLPPAPSPAPSQGPLPAPPAPPRSSSGLERPAPASPVPASPPRASAGESASGEWVLHEGVWPEPLPLASPVDVNHLRLLVEEDEELTAVLADDLDLIGQQMAELVGVDALGEDLALSAVLGEELVDPLLVDAAIAGELAELADGGLPGLDPDALERIEALSAELSEIAGSDPAWAAQVAAIGDELAAEVLPDADAIRAIEELARRIGEDGVVTEEESKEMARRHEELFGHLRERRDEIRRRQEELRRELERTRPQREELERRHEEFAERHEEIRRELDRVRLERAEEMARLAEEMRHEREAEREEMDRARAELERARQMAEERVGAREERRGERRELEELRAEVERLREELRRLRAERPEPDR